MQVFGLPTLTCNSQTFTELTSIHTQKKTQTNRQKNLPAALPSAHHSPTISPLCVAKTAIFQANKMQRTPEREDTESEPKGILSMPLPSLASCSSLFPNGLPRAPQTHMDQHCGTRSGNINCKPPQAGRRTTEDLQKISEGQTSTCV